MAGLSIPTTPGGVRPTPFPVSAGGAPGRPSLGGPGGASPNTPTQPPPAFAPGPYGTAYKWSPGGVWGGTDVGGQAGGFNVGQPGWYEVQKPRTQQDQINEEMQLAQLRRMNLENDMLLQGVPTTGTTRATSSSRVSGTGQPEAPERPGPSVSEIKTAINTLQPQLPPTTPMPTAPPQVEAPKPADTSAARALAYGRAKDVIAQETSGALKGLRESAAQRGVSSAKGEREITRASLGQLANVAAQQAGEEVGTTNRFAELGYQGGLTQRGQNLQAILAAAQNALAARGQNISALPNPVSYIGPLTALQQAGGRLY